MWDYALKDKVNKSIHFSLLILEVHSFDSFENYDWIGLDYYIFDPSLMHVNVYHWSCVQAIGFYICILINWSEMNLYRSLHASSINRDLIYFKGKHTPVFKYTVHPLQLYGSLQLGFIISQLRFINFQFEFIRMDAPKIYAST